MTEITRAEVCAAACADAWRGAGEVLAHTAGVLPSIGARLARLTTSPDLVLTDGEAYFMSDPPPLGRTAAEGASSRAGCRTGGSSTSSPAVGGRA